MRNYKVNWKDKYDFLTAEEIEFAQSFRESGPKTEEDQQKFRAICRLSWMASSPEERAEKIAARKERDIIQGVHPTRRMSWTQKEIEEYEERRAEYLAGQ